MPYEAASSLMSLFIGEPPSHTTIEHMVLGLGALGAHARAYMEQALPPPGDGEVLVLQIDLKCAPTARDSELRKRRGKRPPNPHPESARHRGRQKRRRAGPKKRRKKGDKSKNGRAATLVVMYTLKLTEAISGGVAAGTAQQETIRVIRREALRIRMGTRDGQSARLHA